MPCQSDYGDTSAMYEGRLQEERGKVDSLTQMLCALCKVIENHHPDSAIQQSAGAVPGLREWWGKHKQLDADEAERKRLQEEEVAAELRKVELGKQALNKLTNEEREALGF